MWQIFLLLLAVASPVGATDSKSVNQAESDVVMHFFWSARCPHCQDALPFIESLDKQYPWLSVRSLELTGSKENVARYIEMAAKLGEEARSVPAFFICDHLYVGFDNPDGFGRTLHQALLDCRRGISSRETLPELPGGIDPNNMSLPIFTLTIAALDAFNPCAFFVLLFLLSLLVNARSRVRMLLIGGVFVLFSGLIYFLFMAAWLEIFLLVGTLTWVTGAAGVLAVLIGSLNIKDFFQFGLGPTLSIPEQAKPRLFDRMRSIISVDNTPAMLIGTITLAIAANSYELLCTAGFPMVYTRVLTMNAGGDTSYYLYLLLYNLVYVMPLLLIVLLFSFTMGRRKLSRNEGRVLKLISGLMMFGLGILLLIAPERLNQLYTGILLLSASLLIAFILNRVVHNSDA